jgi:uncharacterized protein (TIGR02246 family)
MNKTKKDIKQIAQNFFLLWNDTLQSNDPQKVTALYSNQATFLPTLCKDFRNGKKDVQEYFKYFLKEKPFGRIIDERVQLLCADCFIHSGKYNFRVGSSNNRKIIQARFTFVWQKKDNQKWKIVHHHSSLKPEKSDR